MHIIPDKSMPVANTGDGVAVNKKASRIPFDLYGIKCPNFHCTAHMASDVIKCMTTSKTTFQKLPICTKHLEQLLNTLKPLLKIQKF